MACAAGAGAPACALHFEVIGLRDVEQVVAVGYGEGVVFGFFVDEGYCASGGGSVGWREKEGGGKGGTHSSPGLGGSRWPWRGVGVEENCRWCRSVAGAGLAGFELYGEHAAILFVEASIPRGH